MDDGAVHRIGSRRRRILALLCVMIAAAPIAAGAVITSGTVAAQPTTGLEFTPQAVTNTLQATPAFATGIPGGPGSLVALLRAPTTMRRTPGGRPLARVGMRTDFGSPQALWVVRHTSRWLGVVSPLAGNGRIGWIPTADASLSREPWELTVSLSARRLTVLEGGRPVRHYTVAVGRPTAPTPTGRFAVTDRLTTGDPAGPYGCCILALSARSPHAIQGWNGGDRIAIHSTPDTGTLGEAVSHGCLRVSSDEARWLLAHVPLGTPALISS